MVGGAAHERKHRAGIVAGLFFHHAVIETAAVDARRRAGLQSIDHERTLAQFRGERGCGRVAGAAGGVLGFADVDLAGQKGAGGQHHCGRFEAQPGLGNRPADRIAFDDQIIDRRLEHGEIGLRFHRAADETAVERAVGLTAGRADRRTLRCIEPAPLDTGCVGGARHDAAERIDLAYKMALADAADGRVAAHRTDGFDVVGQQQRACAGAGGGERGLGASVTAADDDDIECVEVAHGIVALRRLWPDRVVARGILTNTLRHISLRERRCRSWHAFCLSQVALSAACAKAQAGVEQGWPRAR